MMMMTGRYTKELCMYVCGRHNKLVPGVKWDLYNVMGKLPSFWRNLYEDVGRYNTIVNYTIIQI